MQKDLDGELALAGWKQDLRRFSGHLTLCRIKNSKAGIELARISEGYKDFKVGTMLADSICVYQSQLTPSGPVYMRLCNYKMHEA